MSRRRRPVGEHVPEVAVAAPAADLDALHAVRAITPRREMVGVGRCVDRRPAPAGGGARMDDRTLGRTGLRVGALGFGCGNVGGLLIRGTPAERERAVARALELGINYFDTAPIYGDGQSETNLGQVIRALKPRLYVGTKFRVPDVPAAELPAAVARSLEESLERLGLPRVDLLQCHNLVTRERNDRSASVKDMRDAIVPALIRLVEQGKIGFYGMTALGETAALHEVLDAGLVQTA